jgi:GTP-binding protein
VLFVFFVAKQSHGLGIRMPLKIAIIGRPNVGKSTLFNRLAGKKLAIVDDRPGVTRDRRFATGRLGDIDLELIDTAGFEDVSDQSLEARMRVQTERAIEEADLSLFLFDSREGVTPLDQVFAAILRRRDKPVVLCGNKAEGRVGQAGLGEAYGLGFGEPIGISAEHGEGLADLFAAVAAVADALVEPEDDEDEQELEAGDAVEGLLGEEAEEDEVDETKPIRIAIVGRPNAGKSTLVNRLIGEDRLLTGPEAGITRDSISVDWEWEGRSIRLVDTAGLRRKARIEEKLEKLSVADSIRAITFAEIVILVMDATHPFEIQDLQIADLVEREGRALVFVLAKWDLISDPQAKLAEIIEEAQRLLPQVKGSPIVALSAETGRGLDRLMPAVLKVHRDWSTKIKTRDLNDWLHIAVQRHPPPTVNGKRIKPKYMAQIKSRPPTFVLLASRAESLPDAYSRYLVNGLRESFDLPGVPIRLDVRQGANPYAEEGRGGKMVRTTKARQAGQSSRSRKPVAQTSSRGKPAAADAAGAKPKPKPKPRSMKSLGPRANRAKPPIGRNKGGSKRGPAKR